jgi:opine dehydrogenase
LYLGLIKIILITYNLKEVELFVAILGAGSVALANACWLVKEGHTVRIWTALDDERQQLAAVDALVYEGIASGQARVEVCVTAQACLAGADVVMIAAPAFAHQDLIAAAAPCLAENQLVVFHPVTGMSSLLLSQALSQRGIRSTIVDLSTSLFTTRRRGFTTVTILKIKETIDLATIPAGEASRAVAVLSALFGNRFKQESNVLAISLNNHNPIYHVGPLLCNLSRAERKEGGIYWDWITPGVSRLISLLDAERLKVVRHHGTTEVTVEDYFRQAHGVVGANLDEIFPAMSRKLGGPTGPDSFEHRFVVEDVPFGLVFFWSLGRAAGIEMPITEFTIKLTSAIWQRDFVAEGRTVESLGLAGLDGAAFNRVIEQGFV